MQEAGAVAVRFDQSRMPSCFQSLGVSAGDINPKGRRRGISLVLGETRPAFCAQATPSKGTLSEQQNQQRAWLARQSMFGGAAPGPEREAQGPISPDGEPFCNSLLQRFLAWWRWWRSRGTQE